MADNSPQPPAEVQQQHKQHQQKQHTSHQPPLPSVPAGVDRLPTDLDNGIQDKDNVRPGLHDHDTDPDPPRSDHSRPVHPLIDPNLEPQSKTIQSSSFHNEHRPVRKRNRKALSCKPCRNMKVKCDRAMPCDRCLKNNRANDCTYDGEPDPKKICVPGSDPMSELPRYFEEESVLVGKKPPSSPPTLTSKALFAPSDGGPNVRKVGNALTLYKCGKVRYVGGSHWVHLFGEFDDVGPWHLHRLKDFRIYRREIKFLKRQFKNKSRYNYPFCPSPPLGIEEIVRLVPKRDLAEAYLNRYLDTIERTHPLHNEATLRQELEKYWKDPKATNTAWMAAFFMMMFLGCWFMPYSHASERRRETLEALLDGAQACILESTFRGKYAISIIRTHLMIIIGKQCDAMSHDDSNVASVNMAFVTQMAIFGGLHRDPDHFEGMPNSEKFVRRRIWNTLLYMNFQNSMDGGLPILISPRVHDCPAPLNENEHDTSHETLKVHATGFVTDTTHQIILRALLVMACEIVTPMNNCSDKFLSYDLVMKYDYQLTKILDDLPRSLSADRYTGMRPDYRARLSTQKNMVECFIRSLLLVLHRPYAQGQESKEHYPISYYAAIKHSVAFISSRKLLFTDDNVNSPNGLWLGELFKETFTTSILLCYGDVRRKENLDFLNDGLGGLSDPSYKGVMDGQMMAEQEATISEHHYQLYIASSLKLPSIYAAKEGRTVILSEQYIAELKNRVIECVQKVRSGLGLPPFEGTEITDEQDHSPGLTRPVETIASESTPQEVLEIETGQVYGSENFGNMQKELFDTLMNDPNIMLDEFFTSFVFGGFG